uniref:Uncharacterized protein n=1 Tax=Anguilla anguilla TaxID=7936 RepID=A0A0E9UY18_ANGAN
MELLSFSLAALRKYISSCFIIPGYIPPVTLPKKKLWDSPRVPNLGEGKDL